MLLAAFLCSVHLAAAPAQLLRTAGYEAPVRGDPDDLLMIAGLGLNATDRVVYQAAEVSGKHPASVPRDTTANWGVAPILHIDDIAHSLTVRLPQAMRPQTIYQLWVVNAGGEWSEPIVINDPRPLWISPAYVYSTADLARTNRRVRVIGRNLRPATGSMRIRLEGQTTYILSAEATADTTAVLDDYVAEAPLPERMTPDLYSVSVSRDGAAWVAVADQKLEVRSDPAALARLSLADAQFGACRPNDAMDDSTCLARALDAARRAGGAIIDIPPGTWELNSARAGGTSSADGFVLPRNVHLRGAGAGSSLILRHRGSESGARALLTLTASNSIVALGFAEAQKIVTTQDITPVIQLGIAWDRPAAAGGPGNAVDDILIADNAFRRVGRAITDSGQPISHLFITHNEFAAYETALAIPGNRYNVAQPYRIEDAVIRWNRFVPGSFMDLTARQGTIASGLGASHRVDFSSNVADGASTEGLQSPADPPGFRAAFFWNMNGNHELLLVSDNHISCSGDKVGDGEAVSFDGNGDTFAFNGAQKITAAGTDSVTLHAPLLTTQNNRAIQPARYYEGHWIQIVAGAGLGQTRRIVSYTWNPTAGAAQFRVAPHWDVVPVAGNSRLIVTRQYWQAYAVANDVEQRNPPCRKSNLSAPQGGAITMWTPSADSVIAGNRQYDTSGIVYTQGHSVSAPSCPTCSNSGAFQAALEIRDNLIEGEYDHGSDCSDSGIFGTFGASPTPESPPPVGSLGVLIAHNSIARADGLRGGAIDIASTWFRGPPPATWPIVVNPLIFHNTVVDTIGGPLRASCKRGQRGRTGIRLEGPGSVSDAVLYANHCEGVDTTLNDTATATARICAGEQFGSCECSRPSPPSGVRASPDSSAQDVRKPRN